MHWATPSEPVELAPSLHRNAVVRQVYFSSKRLYRLLGKTPSAMVTSLALEGRPVLFSHAPKAGGSSLRQLLGTRGMTHSMPELVLSPSTWHRAFIIAPVRHPFDRFVSGYSYHVRSAYAGTLYRTHGKALKALDPFQYLTFISQYPEKLGPMANWTDYPSTTKPRADLVLRIEDSSRWVEQLTNAGLNLAGRELGHLNATRPAGATPESVLDLEDSAVERLRQMVYRAYAKDYEDFGYQP